MALAIADAVIDFGHADKVVIKCALTGVVRQNADGSLSGPPDFTITVTVTDNRPGGLPHTASRSPDVVR